MGIFDFFSSKPTDEKLTKKLVNFVYDSIQTKNGVRVEDAICLISTIAAERCIEVANEFSIHEHEFEPGAAVFSDKINELLVGPNIVENWNDLPSESVFGTIRNKIVPKFDIKNFPTLISIFESYAQNVGELEWGNINLTIPIDNKPFLLPLQAGYESRKYFEKNINLESNKKSLQIAINALTHILHETKMALDSKIALTLTFELINGMSKTATMTEKKMEELKIEIDK
ncbi:hypothetical protein CJ739_2854 [Mariniflexile rhizosphaerae]|uniref:hypothetical protein n=1 Tax=unclassified Mariniflexile TaxID=2643887 RepID=UPI000CAB2254|nr:hypothetical protein [Mariniflexile sp. TRM1-10]AXP81919.1 hypothetical protein CJ739_2854 [Mariniflexile sp. TRM1-10]PLB20692.1 MAG: hypothetical protein TRG1_260 [Flavobacteriaceae bacterium FS1-H7996/R]